MDVTKSRNQPCWQGQRGLHYLKRRKGANKPDFCTVGKTPVKMRINSQVNMMQVQHDVWLSEGQLLLGNC